jgi:hypothetical protein
MPKRPKVKLAPPEAGEIWLDCYDYPNEKHYLILENRSTVPFEHYYLVLDFVTGDIFLRDIDDWLENWQKIA